MAQNKVLELEQCEEGITRASWSSMSKSKWDEEGIHLDVVERERHGPGHSGWSSRLRILVFI